MREGIHVEFLNALVCVCQLDAGNDVMPVVMTIQNAAHFVAFSLSSDEADDIWLDHFDCILKVVFFSLTTFVYNTKVVGGASDVEIVCRLQFVPEGDGQHRKRVTADVVLTIIATDPRGTLGSVIEFFMRPIKLVY